MAISKVYLNSDVQMDVTDTTASQSDVASTKYYYGADGVKKQGSYVVPSAVTQATPTISVNSSTGLITASATQSAGVVSAGTKSATEQLSTQAAQTIYPSTSDQTIASGKYLTGTQTVKGVLLTNLSAGNIKKDVVVKVGDSADDDRITSVTGTYEGSGGVTPAPEKDVNFVDYDGTILYSYTKAEFANLSALPANPSHTGLTAQGWNWSLSDAKTYVANYGKLWIGQMYITTSGNSEIDITLGQGRLSPYLGIAVNGTVEVDWGDNSAVGTITGSSSTTQIRTQHTYPAPGEYTITISRISGSYRFYGSTTYAVLSANSSTEGNNRVYAATVSAVRIGNNAALGSYGFYYCSGLKYITIPQNTSIVSSAWPQYCQSLSSLTIPNTITNLSLQNNYCYSFRNISLPKGVSSISNDAFYNNYNLQSVCLPDGITTIQQNTFYGCTKLSSIVIPPNVTSIAASAFSGCRGLGEIHFKSTAPPTVSNSNAFSNVPTDCIIYVPSGKKSAYTSSNNYPSSSTYTYVEE